jgi:hypothetical protein
LRPVAQDAQEDIEIAGDDRVDGGFERGGLRVGLLQRCGVRFERGPVVEMVERRDGRARVSAPMARKARIVAKVGVPGQKRCERRRIARNGGALGSEEDVGWGLAQDACC